MACVLFETPRRVARISSLCFDVPILQVDRETGSLRFALILVGLHGT